MAQRTALYEVHLAAGARLVDFGGWEMPVNYGSQIEEHHAVRRDAGMFDVSHMCVVDLQGRRARDYLRHLLANDVGRLKTPGKALYSCMLREHGGVIDDLIVYFLEDAWFRVVVNAATRGKDLGWIHQQARPYEVAVSPRDDLAMIAVQGPQAREKAAPLLDRHGEAALQLGLFVGAQFGRFFVARTGYTGEDGWEIMLPATDAAALWLALCGSGVRQCGLGARDTLRLEAGMNLYGADMNEDYSPLESGLEWTVAFEPLERDFIGRKALEAQKAVGPVHKLVGLVLEDKGVLRSHQKVYVAEVGEGEVTSGTFSPTLERSIGLARVPAETGGRVEVEIRGKRLAARVVRYPFVRHGQPRIEL